MGAARCWRSLGGEVPGMTGGPTAECRFLTREVARRPGRGPWPAGEIREDFCRDVTLGLGHEQGWRRGALLLAGGTPTNCCPRAARLGRAGRTCSGAVATRGRRCPGLPSGPAPPPAESRWRDPSVCRRAARLHVALRSVLGILACEPSLRSSGGARFNLRVLGYRGVRFLRFGA